MPQISFDIPEEVYKKIIALANNFGGNISEAMRVLLDNVFEKDNQVIISDERLDVPVPLSELVASGAKYYSFKDKRLKCRKKMSLMFIRYFNEISDTNLKESLYEFIISLVGYLNRRDRGPGGDDKPALNATDNLSIYDKDGYHVLYIAVSKYLQYRKIIISKLIQCRIDKFQPDVPYVWDIVCETLGKNRNSKEAVVTSDELSILTKKLNSLQ